MLVLSPLPPLRLNTPPLAARVDADVTLSTVARLVASGAALSKADLVPAAGMARTTISAAVDELLARGVLRVAGTRPTAGRGRPADRLALSPRGGQVLLADLGARGAHLAVLDLSQQLVAHEHIDMDVRDGPETVLDAVEARLDVLRAQGPPQVPARAVVIGLPGPVDGQLGAPVRPRSCPDGTPTRCPTGCSSASTARRSWRTTSTCAPSARPGRYPRTRPAAVRQDRYRHRWWTDHPGGGAAPRG